jgi:hypothetical protein
MISRARAINSFSFLLKQEALYNEFREKDNADICIEVEII